MLEVYRHATRHGAFGAHHHHPHQTSALQSYRPQHAGSAFGALGDWTDALLPRSSNGSPASTFNVWELSPNKLRTAAVAFTFVVTAGYISMLAAGGLLAILVTGAVVTCCVLLTVLTCATLITLIVTGVPVGYAIVRLVMSARSRKPDHHGGDGGFGFGSGTAAPGLFSGLFGGGGGPRQGDHDADHPQPAGGGAGGSGFSARASGAGGWRFRAEDEDDADEE